MIDLDETEWINANKGLDYWKERICSRSGGKLASSPRYPKNQFKHTLSGKSAKKQTIKILEPAKKINAFKPLTIETQKIL